MNILVTGSAGFIGANLVLRLLDSEEPLNIVGLDNMNAYYDPSLKGYRLRLIDEKSRQHTEHTYCFVKGDLADKTLIDRLFAENHFDIVVNLAAQAGVRYSIENPDAYIQSNIIGFYNILEACRHSLTPSPSPEGKGSYHGVQHLVYASSSSVYGGNKKIPFSVEDRVDYPVSLYAATKKSNELFAHCYSKLYGIPTTGLRFFTVYGPAGRPDMAYFGFTNKLLAGKTIQIYNYGNCRRDFTYVDDIVEGIVRVMQAPPHPSPKREGFGIHTADPLMYGELKERAEEMRKNPTEAEKVLWEALRDKGLGVKFRQQHIIEDFIVDFYCNEYKVTVEVDGKYHDRPEQRVSDEQRTARLNELGYTELRFTNEEILHDIDNVLKKIKTFCSTTPSPLGEGRGEATPSPTGEGWEEATPSPSGEGWGEATPSPTGEGRGEATPSPTGEGRGEAPYAIYNIGGGQPENLLDFVQILQEELVRAGVLPPDYDFEAHKELVPMQPGDVPTTYADASALERDFGFTPRITLREGLRKFAQWYKEYYG